MPVVQENRNHFISCVEDYLRNNGYVLVLCTADIAWTRKRIGYDVTSLLLSVDNTDVDVPGFIPDIPISDKVCLFPLGLIAPQPIAGRHGTLLTFLKVDGGNYANVSQDILLTICNLFCSHINSMGDTFEIPATLDEFSIGFSRPVSWTALPRPLLRPDGLFFLYSSDRTLPKLARQATIPRRIPLSNTEPETVDEVGLSSVGSFVDTLKSVFDEATASEKGKGESRGKGVIIWIRASTELQTEMGSTGLERQITSIIDDVKSFVSSIVFIICVVEYCSVEQHPWTDREMFRRVTAEYESRRRSTGVLQGLLLSVNIDRVTRRPAEVAYIVDHFAELSIEWWSQGLCPTVNQWFSVREYLFAVGAQLQNSHSLAEEHGFYTRCHQMFLRVLGSSADLAINAITGALRDLLAKYDTVSYVVRVSSPFSEKRSTEPTESLKDLGSSIDPGSPLLAMKLLLVTSVDRLVRRQELFDELVEFAQQENLTVISFLWHVDSVQLLIDADEDVSQTFLGSVCCDLDVDGADDLNKPFFAPLLFSLMAKSQTSKKSLPVVWPMVWFTFDKSGEPVINPACVVEVSKA
ncbi:hypothetical protein HDV05_006475 [Chytridiales sp. JEL 0842]|nr:hypothetical protein HDV05_006475 [Chytridiales sp. JEL 0842]